MFSPQRTHAAYHEPWQAYTNRSLASRPHVPHTRRWDEIFSECCYSLLFPGQKQLKAIFFHSYDCAINMFCRSGSCSTTASRSNPPPPPSPPPPTNTVSEDILCFFVWGSRATPGFSHRSIRAISDASSASDTLMLKRNNRCTSSSASMQPLQDVSNSRNTWQILSWWVRKNGDEKTASMTQFGNCCSDRTAMWARAREWWRTFREFSSCMAALVCVFVTVFRVRLGGNIESLAQRETRKGLNISIQFTYLPLPSSAVLLCHCRRYPDCQSPKT